MPNYIPGLLSLFKEKLLSLRRLCTHGNVQWVQFTVPGNGMALLPIPLLPLNTGNENYLGLRAPALKA